MASYGLYLHACSVWHAQVGKGPDRKILQTFLFGADVSNDTTNSTTSKSYRTKPR
jgi:hypothetical protein